MASTTRKPGEPGTEVRKVNEEREMVKDAIRQNPVAFMEHLRLCPTLTPLCELYHTNVSQLTHIVHELFNHTPRQMREATRKLCLTNLRLTEGCYREFVNVSSCKVFTRAVEDTFPGFRYNQGLAVKAGVGTFVVWAYRSDNVLYMTLDGGTETILGTCYIAGYDKLKEAKTRILPFPIHAFESMFRIC